MHPTLACQLARARTAQTQNQAQRDGLARAARRAHRVQGHRPAQPAPARTTITRRVLTVLGARTSP
jgi:hypothetical protein